MSDPNLDKLLAMNQPPRPEFLPQILGPLVMESNLIPITKKLWLTTTAEMLKDAKYSYPSDAIFMAKKATILS